MNDTEKRRVRFLESHSFVCSCDVCLNDYQPGIDFTVSGPDFDIYFAPLQKEISNNTPKAVKVAYALLQNFDEYRSGEKICGPKEFEFVFRLFSELLEWPFISKQFISNFKSL